MPEAIEVRRIEERDSCAGQRRVRVEARSWSAGAPWRFWLALALGVAAGVALLTLALLIVAPLLLALGLFSLLLAGLEAVGTALRRLVGQDRWGRRNVRVVPPSAAHWPRARP